MYVFYKNHGLNWNRVLFYRRIQLQIYHFYFFKKIIPVINFTLKLKSTPNVHLTAKYCLTNI